MQKRSRRDRLLDEAARQLNARGISGTSLADIASGLGLTRAALYYYADDRQDLVFQCYRRACEALGRDLATAAQAEGSALDRIAIFVTRSLDPDRVEEAVLSEVAYLDDEQRATIEALAAGNLARLVDLIEAGRQDGAIRPCDAQIVARALVGIVSWVPLAPRWSGDDPVTMRPRICAAAIDLIRNGICATPPPLGALPWIDIAVLRGERGNPFDRGDAAAAKREELLRTASRLFNRKGIDATSLDEIGAALGATKGVIYHYLTDKPDLVAQCYRRAFALGDRVISAIEAFDGDGFARAVAGFRLLVEMNARAEFSPLVPLAGIDALEPAARDEIVALARRSEDIFPTYVAAGIADGTIRAVDVTGIAVALAGAFGWIPKWFDGEDDMMVNRISDEFAALYAHGLSAP
ncbi:TetR/AcrR family transcriptional regulator [Sphingopyxis sp.]|uniref:TetR/AcrR family transcriptional regulator n=1 Tax=Sphingopyxis sp. TaxID=1908224 RepID=UPI002ED9880F